MNEIGLVDLVFTKENLNGRLRVTSNKGCLTQCKQNYYGARGKREKAKLQHLKDSMPQYETAAKCMDPFHKSESSNYPIITSLIHTKYIG